MMVFLLYTGNGLVRKTILTDFWNKCWKIPNVKNNRMESQLQKDHEMVGCHVRKNRAWKIANSKSRRRLVQESANEEGMPILPRKISMVWFIPCR